MNVNVDKQNLIPFPQAELRPGRRDGADNNYFAVKESFGEILEREFQIHSETPKSHSEWKPLSSESNSYDVSSDKGIPREVETKTNSVLDANQSNSESTSKTKSKDDANDDSTEEDDLDRDALEYSIGILSNHNLFEKSFLPANEGNESLLKEKSIALSLQKSAEKNPSYANKESKSFLEETKKLAESFLKMGQTDPKLLLQNTKTSPSESLPSNLVMFPNSAKKIQTQDKEKDNKPSQIPFVGKSELTMSGMALAHSMLQKDKGVRGLENETQSEPTLRKLEQKSKPSKNNKLESNHNETSSEKDNANGIITSDKMIRSLGLKDKEFQKQNENKNQVQNEKQKSDSNFVNQIVNVSSSKMGEENGRPTDDKGSSKQGFNFHSVENKLHSKTESVRPTERTEKPKDTNLKQNLDELIKQAKFDIIQNGKSSAEIIMNPKEYGRLTLKVTVDGEKVEGRILVESEELQKSLQNEIQSIRDNLKESGLDLQALIIDLWDDGSQLADRQNQNELYQTLMETAKNRGKLRSEGKDEGLDLNGIKESEDSKVLEFFA
ncbi:flagellar hook-length control protein FliK [Leptospira jelokensis]|uniref:Flagellar hook-length control protein FliK n=1 Tax=Leptospira jelokensis TaxID=2484931 RepID=A0A4Z0ZUJ2_9LEPT|nr:flagellar hook-length control protein FliK [Leptospira jelokensis]TGL72210.1 flagellar hook-length control protein FliK [Leptospira jelokensis]